MLSVDDLRDVPDDSWTVARTSAETLVMLLSCAPLDELSLDYDLGGDETSRPIVLWLAERDRWPAR